MRQVRAESLLATVLMCAAFGGTALGQGRPPGLPPDVPYIAPPPVPQVQIPPIDIPPPTYQGPTEEQIRQWQEDEDRRRAAIAQVYKYAGTPHDPASDYPSRDEALAYLEFLCGVLVLLALTWAVLRVCTHFSQRTDPAAYIRNDPWVRAHLAKNGAASAPPPNPPQ